MNARNYLFNFSKKKIVERNNEHHLKRSKDEISDYHNMVVKIYS